MKDSDRIYTIPLDDYPEESRKLMDKIVSDFNKEGIQVKKRKGSYAINNRKTGAVIIKVLCTSESRQVYLKGLEVAILFRDIEIDKRGLNETNKDHPTLDINKGLVSTGVGKRQGDFYFICIDSEENYLYKKGDILKITKELTDWEKTFF